MVQNHRILLETIVGLFHSGGQQEHLELPPFSSGAITPGDEVLSWRRNTLARGPAAITLSPGARWEP